MEYVGFLPPDQRRKMRYRMRKSDKTSYPQWRLYWNARQLGIPCRFPQEPGNSRVLGLPQRQLDRNFLRPSPAHPRDHVEHVWIRSAAVDILRGGWREDCTHGRLCPGHHSGTRVQYPACADGQREQTREVDQKQRIQAHILYGTASQRRRECTQYCSLAETMQPERS